MKQLTLITLLVLSTMFLAAFAMKKNGVKHVHVKNVKKEDVPKAQEDEPKGPAGLPPKVLPAEAQIFIEKMKDKNARPDDCKKIAKYKKMDIIQGKDLRLNNKHWLEDSLKVIEVYKAMFGAIYKEEAQKAWDDFSAIQSKGEGMNQDRLAKGMTQYNWDMDRGVFQYSKELLAKYGIQSNETLTQQEFTYMNYQKNFQNDVLSMCENCFSKTLKALSRYYAYLDCKNQGWVGAQQLYQSIQNLNVDPVADVDSTAVNDFVLRADQTGRGKVTRDAFVNSVMQGMYEAFSQTTVDNSVDANGKKVDDPAAAAPVNKMRFIRKVNVRRYE